ncbi:MAG: S-layer homology domain-containing protein [Clostridiales Family XIII bacterium]|jgi:beta-glucosidase|nr:S-layer homology domain-containing protein [Clostridiales Family XIII bacterium]
MLKKRILAVVTALAVTCTPVLPISQAVYVSAADDVFLNEYTGTFNAKPAHLYQDYQVDAGARVDDIISKLTLEEKVSLAAGSGTISRLGMNGGRGGGGEGLHGVAWDAQATVFPNSLGLSQSWDTDLFTKIGEAIAKESLAASITAAGRLAPVVDLLRDPRYGRAYETLGEDAYLTGSLATAMASGMNARTQEGYQQFMPILKHFLAYNAEINRLWVASSLTPRTTNEYYIKAFKYPVEAGASKSLMNSYPVVSGKPVSVHPLQHDLLYDWTPDYKSKADGGDGATGHYEYTTTNDYGSGSSLFVHSQRYFADDANGRALGIAEGTKNGQMGWSFREYGSQTGLQYEALARGMATEKDFEENARRGLTMALRLGDLDHLGIQSPYLKDPVGTYGPNRAYQMEINKPLALRASQEQIVLLKNDDNILPLDGDAVDEAVLLGPLADQILKDFYSGSYKYRITIKDALINKLGAANVAFNRAIDTVAIKSVATDKYLVNSDNEYMATGSSGGEPTFFGPPTTVAGTPVAVNGDHPAAFDINSEDDVKYLYEIYDYGSENKLLRTPINGRYVQVTNTTAAIKHTLINNTSAPGEGNLNEEASGQNLNFSTFQKFRLVPTADGHTAIYHMLSGDGINDGIGMAYDVDDEDINRGSYLKVSGTTVVPDIAATNGPYLSEYNVVSPVDSDSTNRTVDSLPSDAFEFDFESVQSAAEAADAAIAEAGADAPIILVLGYEPHLNAREAVDLYKTGLSEQQMRLINYITDDLDREVILIVKTGNPMVIDRTVYENDNVKAILEIGDTGQEEGAAIVSALFDDGYSIPDTDWEPKGEYHNVGTEWHHDYTAYPGYKPESGVIPAYSPAGRLSATWYDGVDQMIGASEEHPPASYVYPDYSEATNDNMSNMNGTINTGLLTYDIIKGERTYQYLNDTPLFAFGYGLSYTQFEYSDVQVGAISNNSFTVSGKVKNIGDVKSDEVVEIYSSFDGTPSRVVQPKNKLIAYDRLRNIEPGAERAFSFTVDLKDKLGVWDVETGQLIVEPGTYTIKAVPSSDTAAVTDNSASLSVTTGNGGTAAAVRNLNKLTLAENFDDYSNVGGRVDDVEMVASSVAYDSNTAVQFRKDGAWISFKDVNFAAAPAQITVRLGSDRAGSLKIYAAAPGADYTSGTQIASINLTDSRPGNPGAAGQGIGPKGVYPGSAAGQALAGAYVKPDWKNISASVTLAAGTYDIYVVTENRGSVVEWLKFGAAADTASGIGISQIYSQDSIREPQGKLTFTADLTPVTAVDTVTWSVANVETGGTALAAIDQRGELTAAGSGNGVVRVTATAGTQTATKDILITNQLASNKISFTGYLYGQPVDYNRTVDFLLIRTNNAFGGDTITRYGASNQQTLAFKELYSENPAGYVMTDTYLTPPNDVVTWTVTAPDGSATNLATIDATGLLTATGTADGKVKVKAVLKNNPDIFAERVITLQNQGTKDTSKWIEAENFDQGDGVVVPQAYWDFSTWTYYPGSEIYQAGGNELGLNAKAEFTVATNSAIGTVDTASVMYKKVDFGIGKNIINLRTASTTDSAVAIWVDGKSAADGGKYLGSLRLEATGNNAIFETTSAKMLDIVSGVHDLYLDFSTVPLTSVAAGIIETDTRFNWIQFGEDYNIVKFEVGDGSVAPADQAVDDGAKVTKPNNPTKARYIFRGWYANSDASGAQWDFENNTINDDLTLYARWVRTGTLTADPVTSTTITNTQTPTSTSGAVTTPPATTTGGGTTVAPGALAAFSDASKVSDWARPFIERLVAAGVISGRTDGTIDPQGYVTRAEFTKMIVSALNIQAGGSAKSFSDVGAADWHKQFVDVASSRNLINGIADNIFAPDSQITRQDIATIAYRAIVESGISLPASDGSTFPDNALVGDYAKDAVGILKQLGVIGGRADGSFDPLALATREETAKIISGIMDIAAAAPTAPAASTEPAADADVPEVESSTAPDGTVTEKVVEADGTIIEFTITPDGAATEKRTSPDGTIVEVITATNGTVTEKTTAPNGTVTEKVTQPRR